MNGGPGISNRGFGLLRQFAERKTPRERCELCSTPLWSEHPHLVELTNRKLVCACDACGLLFSGQSGARYKRVSRRFLSIPGFRLTDAQWDDLSIPIGLAFFFTNSLLRKVVSQYPSPAGATESLLSLGAWNEIATTNPVICEMADDVEALLVNRVGYARGTSPAECYILPIDHCYRLVGIIRMYWRGFSGGSEVWQQIADFFADLRHKSTVVGEAYHA
ncbi:MAG TPA: DUF5947 family protein [Candidatus Binatia bacterium]|nr:DUF5947 family protein [Candidatus Binatia bacterium]